MLTEPRKFSTPGLDHDLSTKRKPGRLNYAPLGSKHEAVHAAADYIRVAIGGVDCGKTYMALAEMLDQMLYNPEGRGKIGLVVAHTATHARNHGASVTS